MKRALIAKVIVGVSLTINIPLLALAKELKAIGKMEMYEVADSLPTPANKSTESIPVQTDEKEKPLVNAIKVVPKARRQAVPVPVVIKVKPVKVIKPKIIKPKIIKPVIRVLQ